MDIYVVSAILPVILLGYYIYKKDVNREPMSLLIKIFVFGLLSFIPILICELIVDHWIPVNSEDTFLFVFIQVFIGIAFIEELFKWIVTKLFGYNNHEFDEIYDIIVYSVFASLGFACIENILYVMNNGLGVALARAFLSVPAHTYMGIMMGYFLSEAKIASINKHQSSYTKNIILSLLVPSLIHALYDALLFKATTTTFSIFIILHIAMVVICISMIHKISKIQVKLNQNIEQGNIVKNAQGYIEYSKSVSEIHFCPICGKKVEGYRFCPHCGFQIQSKVQ